MGANEKQLISDAGIDFITRHEGLRLTKYLDQGGKATIGYGHLILPDEHYETITEDQARTLLAQDSEEAQTAVRVLIRPELLQHQFDALVDFTFNLGATQFARSLLRRNINEELAIHESLWTAWGHVNGVLLPGLVKRRTDEFVLYSTAKYS